MVIGRGGKGGQGHSLPVSGKRSMQSKAARVLTLQDDTRVGSASCGAVYTWKVNAICLRDNAAAEGLAVKSEQGPAPSKLPSSVSKEMHTHKCCALPCPCPGGWPAAAAPSGGGLAGRCRAGFGAQRRAGVWPFPPLTLASICCTLGSMSTGYAVCHMCVSNTFPCPGSARHGLVGQICSLPPWPCPAPGSRPLPHSRRSAL